MNFLYSLLSVLLSLLLSTSLSAQMRANNLSYNSPSNPSAYSYNAPTTDGDELSKKELRSFQRSLARRADDLAEWDLELDDRQIAISGRHRRTGRHLNRNPLPPSLLSQEELFAWESRLDKLAERLINREASIQLRELGVDYKSDDKDHGKRSKACKEKKRLCKAECCKSKEKE